MKVQSAEEGRIAIVTRGHDCGTWCAVYRVVDERYVLLTDGNLRSIQKPKKKQLKHLSLLPISIPVRGKGMSGGDIQDSDIRKALKEAKDAYLNRCNGILTEKEECALVQK